MTKNKENKTVDKETLKWKYNKKLDISEKSLRDTRKGQKEVCTARKGDVGISCLVI